LVSISQFIVYRNFTAIKVTFLVQRICLAQYSELTVRVPTTAVLHGVLAEAWLSSSLSYCQHNWHIRPVILFSARV